MKKKQKSFGMRKKKKKKEKKKKDREKKITNARSGGWVTEPLSLQTKSREKSE